METREIQSALGIVQRFDLVKVRNEQVALATLHRVALEMEKIPFGLSVVLSTEEKQMSRRESRVEKGRQRTDGQRRARKSKKKQKRGKREIEKERERARKRQRVREQKERSRKSESKEKEERERARKRVRF